MTNPRIADGRDQMTFLNLKLITFDALLNSFRPTAQKSLSHFSLHQLFISEYLCAEKVWFSVDKAKVAEVFYADPDIKPHVMQITSTYAENNTFCR